MRKSTLIKVLALMLSFAMLMTGLPAASIAESVATDADVVAEQTEGDTEDAAFPEDDAASADGDGDIAAPDTNLPAEGDVTDSEQPITEDTPVEELPLEDEIPLDEDSAEAYIPSLFSAASPSRFTGEEAVRLGKEGGNIYSIIVQKDGSESTSISRHWVTVDGEKYTAFCIEAPKSSTSGRDGGLEPGTDAGLLWILSNVSHSTDEEYVIKQQAIWAYLGQSFSISGLAAGSRCSMSTEQLRARLTEIVTNAQNASLTGSQELWIAYHLENRSYYQDMVFTVDEPEPVVTPTPVPTATPTPEPTPDPTPEPGEIQVVKQDAATGEMLAGAVFELLSGDVVIATVSTGAAGIVVFTNLLPGTYTVREVGAPTGYTIAVPNDQNITADAGQTAVATFANEKITGKIAIRKVDADSREPLAGATFSIADETGAAVATLVTDSNGTAESDWLPYGTYTITETAAPEHYINSGFTKTISIMEDGTTYTIEVENEPMTGGLIVRKKDALSGEAIPNVQFDVYDAAGNLIATMTTDANGVATCNGLEAGIYTVKEHALPTGYVGTLAVMEGKVTSDVTTVLDVTNTPIQSKIRIIKTDSITGDLLSGAEFSIASADGSFVEHIVTGDDGTATSDWLPYGTYTVTETAAPDHYINGGFTTTIDAHEDGKTYTIEVANEPTKGGICLTKTDSLTGKPIAGVEFNVYSSTAHIGNMTTDANGVAMLTGLEPGVYRIEEAALPTGYTGELVVLDALVESDVTCELAATNTPIQSKIRIIKSDSLTGEMLTGAEFAITDAFGSIIEVITTSEDGTAITGWLPYGTYTITETAAPEHYVNSSFMQTVEAHENGKTYEFTVTNHPNLGGIRLVKTDSLTGKPIAGVEFNVYSGTAFIGTMITDANGVAMLTGLEPGVYRIEEAALPTGYTGELVVLEALIESDVTSEVSATNTPSQSKIRITKTDALTGEVLSGAEFTITDASGSIIEVITTSEDGTVTSGWLPYGTYTVTETASPDHYINSGFTTTIDAHEDGKTYTIEVANEPTKGGIRLTKTDSENGAPIEGVKFNIFLGDTLIATMTTDENGVATCDNLEKGTYIVKEDALPEGYTGELVVIEAVVQSDTVTELHATNTKSQSRIKIVKTDAITGERLPGAEFTVTDEVGNVFAVVTDENGEVMTDWLPYGIYTVAETMAPEHYVNDHWSERIAAYENGMTYTFEVSNTPTMGYLQIIKTDALDGTPIAGVTFDVYQGDELVSSMTTGADGIATSEPLPKGTYTVSERETPTGYVYEIVNLQAEVRSDETTTLTVTNAPIQGYLRIRKQDELTGEALAGAEFTITRISGLPSHNGEGDGEVVAVVTTDAEGVAVSPLLTYGVYKVEETRVPLHFVDNDFSTEMVINEENFCTYEITVENEPTKGWLRLTKTDRKNGNPIEGVVFDVYYADQYGQGLATTMVTDENGVAVSEPLRKGQYTVLERSATAGYVFEQILLDATVHSDETTELSVTNQPVLVKLKLYKRDADEYDGDPSAVPTVRGDGILTGAEFQVLAAADIVDRQGNVIHAKGDVVIPSIMTAGADASVTTEALWPGKYEVKEPTPPTGYQLAKKSIVIDTRDAAKQSEEAIITYEGVIKNEIRYGAQAIVKLLGDGTTEADPTRVETPEKGAEFRVYLASAGSYDNARKFERDMLTTDKNGYAMTKALPYGIYVLEQTKGKEGYEIKGPITFEIDGTESLVNPPPLTLSDQPILYRLKFIKTDSETSKTITLSNASFKLKDADGNYVKQTVFYPREQVIDTFTTDETGSVTLPETVTWGLYTIEEVKAPEGYLIRSEGFPAFVGNSGDKPGETYELEIEIPNDPVKGRILLDKHGLQMTDVERSTDAWGNVVHTPVYEDGYLPGAVFEVRAAENIIGQDGTLWYQADELVDTITTTANGGDASKELPLGKYHLIEISAPAGYFFESQPIPVELHCTDNETALVEVLVNAQNDFLPAEISLFKEKETIRIVASGKDGVKSVLTTEPGEGFVFGLFTAQDMPYAYGTLMADTLVASGATDKNGMLTLSGTFPHGDYYIRELYAPEGWKVTADRFDVSITPDRKAADANVLRVLMVDAIHNELIHTKVTLTKTDITGAQTLPGATIEVYNEAGEVIYRDITDEYGRIANIPVTPGRYTFREVYAPDGYALNDEIMTFTVSEDGVVTGDTTIRDDYTRFSIEKYDENEAPLAGVEFSLVRKNDSADEALMTVKTNRDGVATFEKVPFGSYRIIETRPLAGYAPADVNVEVTVDGTFINPEQPIATIVNVPNEIVIRKVDQDGKPLAGAEFGLFDAFGDRIAVSVSDQNGMVSFRKIPYGSYTIRELKAPDGYLLSKQDVSLTIDAAYQSSSKPVATVVNHLKQVKFIKVDTSGKFLPGVEFSLIDAMTYEVVETVVSNDKGEFIFTKFDYGDWIIRETAAPEGYSRMEDYLLHVDENWTEPDSITLVNIPDSYMFFKSDNMKNALAGVTFTVEDAYSHVVQEVVSAENGVVFIDNLAPGQYIIREKEALEGYTRSEDSIEIVIDENYTTPTKIKRFINYPSIATGVTVSPNMLTWFGVGMIGLASVIVIIHAANRRKQHTHRKRK